MSGGHCYLTIEEIREKVAPLLVPMPKFNDISEKVATNALAEWPSSKEKLIKAHDPSAETLEKINQTYESRVLINSTLTEALIEAVKDGYFKMQNVWR